MHLLDWGVMAAYIAWLVWDGVKRTKLERTTESYFLANRSSMSGNSRLQTGQKVAK